MKPVLLFLERIRQRRTAKQSTSPVSLEFWALRGFKTLPEWLRSDVPRLVLVSYPLGTLAIVKLERVYAVRILGWQVVHSSWPEHGKGYYFKDRKGQVVLVETEQLKLSQLIDTVGKIFS
jgi:hypothetical protein